MLDEEQMEKLKELKCICKKNVSLQALRMEALLIRDATKEQEFSVYGFYRRARKSRKEINAATPTYLGWRDDH